MTARGVPHSSTSKWFQSYFAIGFHNVHSRWRLPWMVSETALQSNNADSCRKAQKTGETYVRQVFREKREEYREKEFEKGPALERDDWRGAGRTKRAILCRLTYHGHHFKICEQEDYFEEQDERCKCICCGDRAIDRLHVKKRRYFYGETPSRVVREILENCKNCE